MKYNQTEKCPACSHTVEISKKTKVLRKEQHYINIMCDVCSHIFPIKRRRDDKSNIQT